VWLLSWYAVCFYAFSLESSTSYYLHVFASCGDGVGGLEATKASASVGIEYLLPVKPKVLVFQQHVVPTPTQRVLDRVPLHAHRADDLREDVAFT